MTRLPAVGMLIAAMLYRAEAEPRVRLVWNDSGMTLLGTPSPDGTYLSFADPSSGALAVREFASGRIRAVASRPPGSKEHAYFSTVSPDSRRIAFAWLNDEGYYDLRVVNLDGSGLKTLYRNEEAGFVQPCAWSPDGTQVLTLLFRKDNISQIVLVPAAGGPPKVLRSLNWVYPKKMDWSPDGRHIVYDSFAAEGSGDRTLFLLSVDGSRETKLIDRPGNHMFPVWSPDGARAVYASDQGGGIEIWSVGIPDGRHERLGSDLGRVLPLGVTRAGDYYFGVRSGSTDVFVASLDDSSTNAKRATLRFPGRNSAPEWSPDGNQLAYLSRRGAENFGEEARIIVIRSVDAEQEREVAPKLAHLERVRWAPDGHSLLVSGSDNKGRAGLYRVDARTAATEPIVDEPGAAFRGFDGVWSKDGASVFYLHEGTELRRRHVSSGRETTLYRAAGLHGIVRSPDGRSVAVCGENVIALVPTISGEVRRIPFDGVTEVGWSADLVAARGTDLWRVPLDGSAPQKLKAPGNRTPGFSLHPDGKRIALTAGRTGTEIWTMKLGAP